MVEASKVGWTSNTEVKLGKCQYSTYEIAGSSQRDGAPADLRCHRNGNEFSKASGVDHFHAAEVDHDSTGLGSKLGNFARQRGSFNAISVRRWASVILVC
jgi:hypothetical protein